MKIKYNDTESLKVILSGVASLGRDKGIDNDSAIKMLNMSRNTFYKVAKVKDFNSMKLNELGKMLELYGYELELVVKKIDENKIDEDEEGIEGVAM